MVSKEVVYLTWKKYRPIEDSEKKRIDLQKNPGLVIGDLLVKKIIADATERQKRQLKKMND